MSRTQNYPESTPSVHAQAVEDLASRIRNLQAERSRHLQAIAEIDKVLAEIQQALTGVNPGDSIGDGNTDRPRRRYQKLELTGEEAVLEFVRSRGNPSTAQVNAHWHAQGRPGVANPILARLLKRGLLKRENDPAVRGSRYRISP